MVLVQAVERRFAVGAGELDGLEQGIDDRVARDDDAVGVDVLVSRTRFALLPSVGARWSEAIRLVSWLLSTTEPAKTPAGTVAPVTALLSCSQRQCPCRRGNAAASAGVTG
jgi:hypothetical protein